MAKEESIIDRCIICNKKTPYKKSTSIFARLYYVEGIGQLCKKCYDEL